LPVSIKKSSSIPFPILHGRRRPRIAAEIRNCHSFPWYKSIHEYDWDEHHHYTLPGSRYERAESQAETPIDTLSIACCSSMSRFVKFPTQATGKADASRFNRAYYRRIVVWDGFVKGLGRCKQESLSISRAWIPESISMVIAGYFGRFRQFDRITFEIRSRLTQIESRAFSSSSLESIVIPMSVELLRSSCFSWCALRSLLTARYPHPLTTLTPLTPVAAMRASAISRSDSTRA
jgi:hypothetical protein